jgi:hypothetical protein
VSVSDLLGLGGIGGTIGETRARLRLSAVVADVRPIRVLGKAIDGFEAEGFVGIALA